MYFGFFQLGGREPAGLVQNMVRDRQLADVVEQRAGPQCVDFIIGESKHLADADSVDLRPPDVTLPKRRGPVPAALR